MWREICIVKLIGSIYTETRLKWRCTNERCIRTVHPKLDDPEHQVQDRKPPGKRCSSHQRDSCVSAELHSVRDSQLAAVHLHLKARQCLTEPVCQRSLTLRVDGRHKLHRESRLKPENGTKSETFLQKTPWPWKHFWLKRFKFHSVPVSWRGRRTGSCWCVWTFLFCLAQAIRATMRRERCAAFFFLMYALKKESLNPTCQQSFWSLGWISRQES